MSSKRLVRAISPDQANESARLEARRVHRALARTGTRAFEAAYAPRVSLPEHYHAAPFFTYVLRGSYIEHAGCARRDCQRGAVVLHDAGELHSNVVGSAGTASLNVEIAPELWHHFARGPARDSGRLVGRVLTGDVEWLAVAVWREFHRDDDLSALGMDEAIARLCAEVHGGKIGETLTSSRRIDACAEYIADHLDEPPRFSEATALLGVHPMHAARLFRKRFGCSMGEFARRRRIAWACEKLGQKNQTIASIAVQAGFADHAHFTRTFRRLTGCTPRWYRARVMSARPA